MILTLENISKSYDPVAMEHRKVLDGLSLNVKAGDTLSILGPSGIGKSTLLNIIGLLDKPDTGSVILEGKDVSGLNDKELSGIRNTEIGFIFQSHHLLPQFNILENVLIPAIPQKNNAYGVKELAMELIEKVGLKDHMLHRPGQLSVGQCQRVAVIRALINNPKLVLADEPTGSLDEQNADALSDLLLDLNKEHNVSLIVVTHSASLASKMNTVYHLKEGKLHETR